MTDKPIRWFYIVAVFFALMPNMDRLTATPFGAAVWFTALIVFSWPIIRFGRVWLAAPEGGAAAGVATFVLQRSPALDATMQTKFVVQLTVFAVGLVLCYVVLVRGYRNPYKPRR